MAESEIKLKIALNTTALAAFIDFYDAALEYWRVSRLYREYLEGEYTALAAGHERLIEDYADLEQRYGELDDHLDSLAEEIERTKVRAEEAEKKAKVEKDRADAAERRLDAARIKMGEVSVLSQAQPLPVRDHGPGEGEGLDDPVWRAREKAFAAGHGWLVGWQEGWDAHRATHGDAR